VNQNLFVAESEDYEKMENIRKNKENEMMNK
jgi:hypothetical protein